MDTAHRYRQFSEKEARGNSAVYELLTGRIAADPDLLARIDQLPPAKRQPNLLLGSVRFLDGPVADYPSFRDWTLDHWDQVSQTMLKHRTQTNEAGRCAALLPLLAALPQPLALIEAGTSAGLCLYPDRYRYRYDNRPVLGPADSPVELTCRTSGDVPFCITLPTVVWRAGVDLHPLSASDPDDVRWLESLVWPGQPGRLSRLRGAVEVARAEPAHLVAGDLRERVPELVAQAPAGATVVVFDVSVLGYLRAEDQAAYVALVQSLPCRWVACEAEAALPAPLPRPLPEDRLVSVLALDGRPVAFAGPHGQTLDWFGP
jgi:hypothetical protein